MDLRQLRYLVAVADEGSITAAAAACLVAQPSLSQALQALERDLGTDLFRRVGRGVVLTSAGEAAVASARDTLAAAESVRSSVAAVTGLLAGRLEMVALPTLAVDPLAPLLGALRERHPQLTVRLLQPEDTDDLLDVVRSGRAELGLTELPPGGADLECTELREQELVAVLARDAAPATDTMSLTRLAELPLIASPRGTSTRRVIDEALASIGREANVLVETEQREAIIPLVLAGAGAAVLPTRQAEAARALGASVVRFRPRLQRRVALVRRRVRPSPAAAAFLELAGAAKS